MKRVGSRQWGENSNEGAFVTYSYPTNPYHSALSSPSTLPIADCQLSRRVKAMLRFIFFVIVFFLVMRVVLRVLKFGLRFFIMCNSKRSQGSPASFSSGKSIQEADYEVIESNLNDNERKVGK